MLLVCRADIRGLTAAQSALTQWVSKAAPAVDLLGLAVLADAPGKTPKPLRDFTAIIAGGPLATQTKAELDAGIGGHYTAAAARRILAALEFADGASGSPGESVSRAMMHRLGSPPGSPQRLATTAALVRKQRGISADGTG